MHQGVDRGRVRKIAWQDMHARAKLPGKLVEDFDPGAGNGDRGALRMKHARNTGADGAGCPGDQCGFSREIEHFVLAKLMCRLESGDIIRAPTADAVAAGAIRLIKPVSTLPAPTS